MSGSPTPVLELDSRESRKIQQHHHHPEILRFRLSFPIILLRYAEQRGVARPTTETALLHNVVCFKLYRVIPSVLDPRKCEYLKDYSLDFE
jgi:hypothetical protein